MIDFNLGRTLLDISWLTVLLLLLYHFWQKRNILIEAQDWLRVKGHITRYQLVQVGHSVWPKIEYVYRVHDKDLLGHYLFLDTAHNSPSSKYSRRIAYTTAVAYNEQLEVDVYYNPNHPEQSALDVTMPIKLTVIVLVIAGLIAVHLAIIIWRLF